ncbi:hypothetical protein GFY24_10835 [Nocardia sp. SYP-A9097]|uniref:hypothetical protein n=1 Tax=Nocardia sp. SYP-A9097 TaxID=2663237 RepID=UPI00129A4D71|nr:hypothetical protein [Nocardia sp. SYP-A9097]MRH87935.1 hypothetical protein [Nocardia sp. SYP-A9097]
MVASCLVTGAQSAAAEPGSQPLGCVPAIGSPQLIPPLPGLFLPLPSVRGVSEFDDLATAPADLEFPPSIEFRDNTKGFNDFVEVVLRRGSLYARPRNSNAVWRKVVTPGCLDGGIVATSVNANMLVAIDRKGWIYSMDNLLSGPMLWNWTRSYGGPIWLWPGFTIPDGGSDQVSSSKWALSHRTSSSFVDAQGNTHPLTAGLVEIVSLTGDGSRITYQDPWLPADLSYEIGGPEQGRFISESLSVSGSVTVVMNRYGDMYTRKYDLDLAGSNHIPERYTWQPQGPAAQAPNQLVERFDSQYAAVSLPAEDWRKQPKIPGEITSRLSIQDTGPAVEDRELRVEGRRDGRTGYWHKGLADQVWQFSATDEPLAQPVLTGNSARDQSRANLAPESPLTYRGGLPADWTLRVEHFDWAQTKHDVELVSPTGRAYPVQLYTTDGLRLLPRAAGLDNNPRGLEGALDLRSAEPWLPEKAELAAFMSRHLNGQQVYEVTVHATESQLVIDPLGSILNRTD